MTENPVKSDKIRGKEFYLILSSITDKPYVSDDMSVFCFEKKADGLKFVQEHKDTKIGIEPVRLNRPDFRRLFLDAISKVKIVTAEGDHLTVSLNQKDFRDHIGNENAVKNLTLLEQTGLKKYMRNLNRCDFYMPVYIDIRKPGHIQKIHGCKAERNGRESRLIFATVWDFNEWNKLQKREWDAVKISFKEAADMAKGTDINIYKHLIADQEMIRIIQEEKKNG